MRSYGGLADNFMLKTMTADVYEDDELPSGRRPGQGRAICLGRGYRLENESRPDRILGVLASFRHRHHVVLPDHSGKSARDQAPPLGRSCLTSKGEPL